MFYLSANNGPQAGKRYELRADRTVMGRHAECQVVIDVGAVSRQHARVVRDGNDYYLEDLNSRNGTFLNDEPTKIAGRRLLKPGDVVRVCEVSFTFHSDMPFGPKRLPGVTDGAGLNFAHQIEKASSDTVDGPLEKPAGQHVIENTRARLIVNAGDELEEVVRQIRSKLRGSQLVFCAVPSEHAVNGLLTDRGFASPAFNALVSDYSGILVLNAQSGLQADGTYDMEAFYRDTFQVIKEQLQLDISDTHHEQEIVQILRDISQLFLCVLHLDCVPLDLIPRIRCLLQEGHSSLVCYSPVRTAESSAPQESKWENGMLDKLSPQSETSRESPPNEKPPGKLPPAKSIGEAAADMLKKFIKRR